MKNFLKRLPVRKAKINRGSVKESFDNLPSGVCFFAPNGMLILCNYTMYRLVYTMIGRDLQVIGDLWGALEKPVDAVKPVGNSHTFWFPDGRVWRFSQTPVTDENGASYIQFLAQNVTELDRLSTELEQRNEEIRALIAQFQRIAKNVLDITRQQEILSAKMRIHSKMGNCVINTQRYCVQDCPAEGKETLLQVWEETLATLKDEIGREDDEDPTDELVRVAKNCGVEITVTGIMPADKETSYLLVAAMRECLTNTITHAQGDRLNAQVRYVGGRVTAVITNNGRPPEGEITEGGGLSSLRKRIEDAGGAMRVQSRPTFALTVTLPDKNAGKGELPL